MTGSIKFWFAVQVVTLFWIIVWQSLIIAVFFILFKIIEELIRLHHWGWYFSGRMNFINDTYMEKEERAKRIGYVKGGIIFWIIWVISKTKNWLNKNI